MLKLKTNLAAIVFAIAALFFGTSAINPGRLAAQGTTATILGTVADPSGGAIAEAAVVVRNVGTGNTQSATTDTQGRYSVANLEIGDYEVEVSKTGFTTVVHKAITLTVGNQSVVDFTLPVGAQSQSVTVESQVVQGADARFTFKWPRL
jgi:Carboxypeptidase regulatory-like domain